jgi:GDP-L-fucose synthase
VIRKLHLGRLLMEGDMTSIRRDLDRWSAARDWLSEPEEAVLGELAANGITPRKVELWGTGLPRREFLHVDDLARACLFLSEGSRPEESGEIINVGTGEDLSIAELAGMVREIVGYEGEIAFDADKPDGTPQKLLDTSHIERLRWTPAIGLRPGLEMTYRWYRQRASRRGPPARSARP